MVLVHVHRFPNKQNHPHTIHPNETVGAAPVCPPERPHSGVSIPTNTRIVRGKFNDGCAPAGRHGRAHRHRPYQSPSNIAVCPYLITLYIRQFTPTTRGVPIPHRGYTFDSAGLASATQPTLGNNASEEATPLGVVLFLITHHHHTRRMNDLPHEI